MNDDCLTQEEKDLLNSGTLSPEETQEILENAINRAAY